MLKRLDDAVRDGDTVYAVIQEVGDAAPLETLESADGDVGHAGAASGMAALVKAILCLHRQVLPPSEGRAARPWLRNRIDGPRRAAVGAGVEGGRVHVLLEEHDADACVDHPERLQPRGDRDEALFVIEGRDAAALKQGLDRLRARLNAPDHGIEADARAWFHDHPGAPDEPLAVAFVAQNRIELRGQIDWARRGLAEGSTPPPAFRDRVFFSPRPLGPSGKIAFVYPGSGNDYPGMGRELAVQWPELLRRQDAENERLCSQFVPSIFWDEPPGRTPDARQKIFGQVALGGLTTDLVRMFGVRPDVAVGYSLGESAALFALRAWAGRDVMLKAMNESTLFAGDLTGRCDAARKAWKLPPDAPVEWTAGLIVDRAVEEVRAAVAGVERAYLLIINTPRECVVGGDRAAVSAVGRRLRCTPLPLPETSTVHCPVAREVAEAYRRLHLLPTTPPLNVRFYSAALGRAYEVTEDNTADAILAQALDAIDFPAVIEAAYRDGLRIFVEMGPGASCTRMIGAVLGDRPHRARSVCAPGADGVSAVLRLLGMLVAERVAVDLRPLYSREVGARADAEETSPIKSLIIPVGGEPFAPPSVPRREFAPSRAESYRHAAGAVGLAPLLAEAVATREAHGQAHAAFLRYTDSVRRTVVDGLAFQTSLLDSLLNGRAGAA